MILPILYKLAKTGKVTSWFISTDGSTVITETGYVEGAKKHLIDTYPSARTADIICSDLWHKQLLAGYTEKVPDV